MSFFTLEVYGEPVTYGNDNKKRGITREADWRAVIRETATNMNFPFGTGYILHFHLGHKNPLDIDNLCVPVFQALREMDKVKGNYANINWWLAKREVKIPSKLTLIIENRPPQFPINPSTNVFHKVYSGDLPDKHNKMFEKWVLYNSPGNTCNYQQFAISLKYGSQKVNIGSIPSESKNAARVKGIVDRLYPIIGGYGGSPIAPDDWKIDILCVERGVSYLKENELEIKICAII